MGSNINSENLRSEISTSRDIQTRKRTRNHFYTPQIYLGYGSGTTTSRSMLPFFDLRRGSKTRARASRLLNDLILRFDVGSRGHIARLDLELLYCIAMRAPTQPDHAPRSGDAGSS